MYKKICPQCHQPSFSSSEFGKWICPICQHDLTNELLLNAENSEIKPTLKEIERRLTKRMDKEQPYRPIINKYI